MQLKPEMIKGMPYFSVMELVHMLNTKIESLERAAEAEHLSSDDKMTNYAMQNIVREMNNNILSASLQQVSGKAAALEYSLEQAHSELFKAAVQSRAEEPPAEEPPF